MMLTTEQKSIFEDMLYECEKTDAYNRICEDHDDEEVEALFICLKEAHLDQEAYNETVTSLKSDLD